MIHSTEIQRLFPFFLIYTFSVQSGTLVDAGIKTCYSKCRMASRMLPGYGQQQALKLVCIISWSQSYFPRLIQLPARFKIGNLWGMIKDETSFLFSCCMWNNTYAHMHTHVCLRCSQNWDEYQNITYYSKLIVDHVCFVLHEKIS